MWNFISFQNFIFILVILLLFRTDPRLFTMKLKSYVFCIAAHHSKWDTDVCIAAKVFFCIRVKHSWRCPTLFAIQILKSRCRLPRISWLVKAFREGLKTETLDARQKSRLRRASSLKKKTSNVWQNCAYKLEELVGLSASSLLKPSVSSEGRVREKDEYACHVISFLMRINFVLAGVVHIGKCRTILVVFLYIYIKCALFRLNNPWN